MYLKIYHTINNLPLSINKIFEQNEKKSLFLGKQWFKLYEQYFLTKQSRQFLVIFNKNKQALALFLLYKKNRKLLPVSNFYTAFFTPLIRDNMDDKTLHKVYRCFIHQYLFASNIQSIEIMPVYLESLQNQLLIKALKKYNFIIKTSFYCANWTENVAHINFEQYYKQRPSILKNTIKRKTNKLNKEAVYAVNIYTDLIDITTHIAEYEKIYQLSWKTDEASAEFIRDFMLTYARSGHTRLGIAKIDDQVVASQFWLVHNDIALIYKLAYDPNYKKYSIGSILTSKMMEYVIDTDGVKKLDYLTGDDNYKKDWMSQRQELSSILAYNSYTLNGLSKGMLHLIKSMIKKILRFFNLAPD